MPRLEDWALASAAEMAAIYRHEAARWRTTLDWDTAGTWDEIERARRNGRVSGYVIRNEDGTIHGWTYYLLHGSELQIGGLAANSPGIVAALLDAVMASPAATVATRALFFAFTAAPAVAEVLAARGFDLDGQPYLVRALGPLPSADWGLRPWRDQDADAVAALLGAAYGGPDPRRAFVPSNGAAEWRHYVRQLTGTIGCGRFAPFLSRLAWGEDGSLAGAALVTAVSDTCAHLAQLAVHPGAAGAGVGARLLAGSSAAAWAAGYARLSLLVSAGNARAQRLYGAAGFAAQGTFVTATRLRPGVAQRRSPAA